MGMPRALAASGRGRGRGGSPVHAPGVDVPDDAAVDLALARLVLGDVGDPELVWPRTDEVSLDEVSSDVLGFDPSPLRATTESLQASASPEESYPAVADLDAAPESEFGVDSPTTVDPAGLDAVES